VDALVALTPCSDRYAVLPISDAFDWTEVGNQLGDGEWYLVAFRSVRRPDSDEARLAEYDERAHLEAAASPGFVHYFKGPTCSDRTCMSFCLWTSRSEARAASGGPRHVEAVSLLGEMYERYTLEFLRVTGRAGRLSFEPYDPPLSDDPVTDRAA
jgi:hypothetical protein